MNRPLIYWSIVIIALNVAMRLELFLIYVVIATPFLLYLVIKKRSYKSLFIGILVLVLSRTIFIHNFNDIEKADVIKGRVYLTGKLSSINKGKIASSAVIKSVKIIIDNKIINLPKAVINFDSKLDIKNFTTIVIKAKKEDFDIARNQGNFDAKKYWYSKGIYAKFRLISLEKMYFSNFVDKIMSHTYEYVIEKIDVLKNKDTSSIYKTILIGAKGYEGNSVRESFSIIGVSHILVISGLHITIVANFIYFLLKLLGFSKEISAIIITILLIIYVGMAGIGVSTLRAFVMYLCLLVSYIFGRTYDRISSLSLIFCITLITQPFIFDYIGFVLSYSIIIFFSIAQYIIGDIEKTRKTIYMGAGVVFLMTPLIIFYFYKISLYTVLANLLMIPLLSFVISSGIVGVMISLVTKQISEIVLNMGALVIEYYIKIAEIIEKFPYSQIVVGSIGVWKLILCYFLILLAVILWERYKLKRIFGIALLSYMVIFYKPNIDFSVSILDVGQGDSILIQNDFLNILVDCGSVDKNFVGKYRVIPTLSYKGIDKIDYAFISHLHKDHYSGMIELLKLGMIDNLVLSYYGPVNKAYIDIINIAKKAGTSVYYISAGDKMKLNDIYLECLHPYKDYKGNNPNSFSQTFLMKYKDKRILLTGDLEKAEEELIISNNKINLSVDILKVGHHGSKTSSSNDFLDKVKPKFAVVSCGVNNKFGHPSGEVVDRIIKKGSQLDITSLSGQIEYIVEDGEIHKRVWLVNGKKATVAD